MGRKSKQSPTSGFVELVALLPWWAGIALALVSYLVLQAMAVGPKPVALQPGQMAPFVGRAMVSSFAAIGQYLVPALCLVAALMSWIGRRKREKLVASVARSRTPDSLHGMSWQEFELLVGEAFRLQGYQVTETGGGGADGGVDLVLRKGTETWLVQCKQWKAYMVDVRVVRELYGVMAARGAVGGFVVTSGAFSNDAQAFASGRNVKLIDGLHLFGLLQDGRESRDSKASMPSEIPGMTAPSCPICSAPMVRRVAKQGANAGAQFWGCSTFPACRGTRR